MIKIRRVRLRLVSEAGSEAPLLSGPRAQANFWAVHSLLLSQPLRLLSGLGAVTYVMSSSSRSEFLPSLVHVITNEELWLYIR
jgi:hypothetical protein